MLTTVVLCFVIACLCPIALRLLPRLGAWLALIPLGLFIYFVSFSVSISQGKVFYTSLPWLPMLDINLSFYLDGLNNLFALLISGIGVFIVLYSSSYLRGHRQLGRFYAYLFFFMGAMFGIILSNNLISLFVFWELTTLSSFLLISFDHCRSAARRAALQGLIITAGGGLALLTGFILIKLNMESFNISTLLQSGSLQHHPLYPLIVLLVLFGAFTKSAQFPFHFWLPNAMEAPTPVSAYLHSATMVQAGVYLVARLTPLLGHSYLWEITLALFGSMTMIATSILAIKSSDIKKILAYSTTMALGLSFSLLAFGQQLLVNAAILFFFTHALYKAGLFLAAGNIDHATGTRNIYQLGGLARILPITWLGIIICSASMAGLPPLLGFVSKELIYEAKLSLDIDILLMIVLFTNIIFATIAIMLTIKPFFGSLRTNSSIKTVHEQPWQQWIGIIVIACCSALLGIFPHTINHKLISPATQTIINNHNMQIIKLSLWHGLSPAFYLSIFTLTCAIVLFSFHKKIYHLLAVFQNFSIEKMMVNLSQLFILSARLLTQKIQHGYLPRYLATVLTFISVFVGAILFLNPNWHITHIIPRHTSWFDFMLVSLILISAVSIALKRNYIASITCLSVIGICSSLIFLIHGAPDVAITQLLVDILTIVIVVLALYRLPGLPKISSVSKVRSLRNITIAAIFGTVITTLLLAVTSTPLNHHVTNYYANHAYALAHGRNIVNVILVDFRNLDTLGEILVVALAGLGVYGLLKVHPRGKKL